MVSGYLGCYTVNLSYADQNGSCYSVLLISNTDYYSTQSNEQSPQSVHLCNVNEFANKLHTAKQLTITIQNDNRTNINLHSKGAH